MSDTPHGSHIEMSPDEDHTGPIKNPKQMLVAVAASFIIPVFAIIGLVYYVASDNKPSPGVGDAKQSLAQRIQKVGTVEIRDANRELKNGEAVYTAQCAVCHAAGVAGAPKFGDGAAWAARIKTGYEALLVSALKGKGAMGAQGGGDFEDTEIGRAVVHLANSAGGKFEAPKAPAPVVAAESTAK
ncbi:MAG: c-type cytochrome [Burkholderiales bacterium]